MPPPSARKLLGQPLPARRDFLKRTGVLDASPSGGDSVADLRQRFEAGAETVLRVAARSGNLKGGFVRDLKTATEGMREAFFHLWGQTSSDLQRRWRSENEGLHRQLAELRAEVAAMKAAAATAARAVAAKAPSAAAGAPARRPREEFPPLPRRTVQPVTPAEDRRPAWAEELMRATVAQARNVVEACLANYGLAPVPTLGPSLGGRPRMVGGAPAGPAPSGRPGPRQLSAPTPPPLASSSKGKGKGKGKATATVAPPHPVPQAQPAPVASTSAEQPWTEVTRRKRKGKKKKASRAAPVANKKRGLRPADLRSPRSTAVVVELTEEGLRQGGTYAGVLRQATQAMKGSLAEMGLAGGVHFKVAATGARILEVPGATSGDKADRVAATIRSLFPPEEVKVSRPVKSAEMRVTGLDDSASSEDVAAAVAQAGACPQGQVRVGEMRRGVSGLCTVVVRCPIAAAKKVAAGRLLVGMVSAQVNLLEPRPRRCYRCLEPGHVRQQCTAETDRSDLCYRCGQPGHKAAACSAAKSSCSICSAAGRPAEHRMGSKSCSPPKRRRARGAVAGTPAAPAPSQAGSSRGAMDIN